MVGGAWLRLDSEPPSPEAPVRRAWQLPNTTNINTVAVCDLMTDTMDHRDTLNRCRQGVTACMLALFLSACATVATEDGEGTGTSAADSPALNENGPATPLAEEVAQIGESSAQSEQEADLIYDLLLMELAGQRDDAETAWKTALRAAGYTRNAQLAARATRVALSEGELDGALEAAQLWDELSTDDPSAKEALAVIHLTREEPDQAMSVFRALLDANKDDSEKLGNEYRRIADLLTRQKKGGAPLEMISKLVELHPENKDAWFAKGLLADRLNENEKGLAAVEKALSIDPAWEDAAIAKSSFLLQLKKNDEFKAHAEAFIASHPEAARFRLQYARALVDDSNADTALDEFEAVLALEPDNLDALFAAGVLAIQSEKYETAVKHLQRSVELRPDNDQARLYLGQAYGQLGEYEDASRTYLEVSQDAFYFESRRLFGTVKAKSETVDAAITYLRTLSPNDDEDKVQLFLTQEQIYRDAERLDDALTTLNEGLDAFPTNSDLLYARGLVAAQLEMIEVYEGDFRKLIENEPDNAHAYNALGYSLADQTDRYDEALALIEKALELRPDDAFIIDSMGWIQYRMGNLELAREYLEKALAKRPDAEIAAHLGEVLWKLGNKKKAKSIWNAAKEREPDNSVLTDTIQNFLR